MTVHEWMRQVAKAIMDGDEAEFESLCRQHEAWLSPEDERDARQELLDAIEFLWSHWVA